MRAPEPLLFDLDGTLVDSLADIGASANRLRREFGLEDVPLEVVRGWVGDGIAKLLERALAPLGPFEPHRERALEVYREHHREQCVQHVRPYPGVVEHLRRWHGGGHPMAVVTNKAESFARRVLDHVELSRWLPVLIAGDTVAQKKPHAEPLREALRRLGVPAARGAMIGDGRQDLRAAKAAGLRPVAALYGFGDAAALRAEGADEYWVAFGVPSP